MNVFIARDGATIGEYPREQLEAMAQAGELQPEDHYWQDGMKDWLPLPELLGPAAFEPLPPPPPPPNYLKLIGIAAGVLFLIGMVGFFLIKPDRGVEVSKSMSAPSPPQNAATGHQVRDKAAAELQRLVDRLPSQPAPPLHSGYYDVTINMYKSLSPRASWMAVIKGRENTIDPNSGSPVSQSDFSLTADYEDDAWVYKKYHATVSGQESEVDQDAETAAPPSIVGILGMKTSTASAPISITIPQR